MPVLFVFALTLLGGFLFPWWWPSLAGYLVGALRLKSPAAAFASGFAGTAGSWLTMAFCIDWRNHHLLSGRVAQIFFMTSPSQIIAATAVIGGIFGGMGC